MNGCVFRRTLPSGKISWGYSIDIGRDETRKRRQLFKSGLKRKGEAADALRKTLNEKEFNELVKPDHTTFAGFMTGGFGNTRRGNARQKSSKDITSLLLICFRILAPQNSRNSPLGLERLFNHLKDAGGKNRKDAEAETAFCEKQCGTSPVSCMLLWGRRCVGSF